MKLASILLVFSLYFFLTGNIFAVSDPLSLPNNKIGIHILFPSEIHEAAQIVNNHGSASWGYVTVPIQAKDRDRVKWQEFLNKCKEEKVIPIIRVATVPEGSSWVTPNDYDLIDFANFLNDLKWPTQNRYIILFNEVNRADEYGGSISPESYADILNNAIDIFKVRSEDFFILPAGLDNAASDRRNSINWKEYLRRMYLEQPDIFNKIDGWTSHAYPNPDFSVRPDVSGFNKIDSFKYDLQYLKSFTGKKLPVFITETGWSEKYLSEHQISLYYQYAMSHVWNSPEVVAVTPFLLNAQDGPFSIFSFLNQNRNEKEFASYFSSLAINGSPGLAPDITPALVQNIATPEAQTPAVLGTEENSLTLIQKLYNSFKFLLTLFK